MVMYHILKKISINLFALILIAMKDAVFKKKAALPYGMALTHVFRLVGIRLKDEASSKLGHTNIYNKCSIHGMRFNKVLLLDQS